MLEETKTSLQGVRIEEAVGTALADAGYCSEENLKDRGEGGPELLIAMQKDWRQRKEIQEAAVVVETITPEMSGREKREMKLRTERGKQLYKLCSQTVEPVFGQIKTVWGATGLYDEGSGQTRASGNCCVRHTICSNCGGVAKRVGIEGR